MSKEKTSTASKVLARAFRPQKFSDVLGQDAIVQTLRNAISQKRLAHAYLFSGPRGTGKTTLARLLAKALNCQKPEKEVEPCGTCQSCLEIGAGTSMDVLEIDGASNRGIEDIRKINETVAFTPSSGSFKIYIIDEVHMLTKEAFNALLKTLEEPPKHAKFFFATTELHKVLPTIISRCQRFQLRRIAADVIVKSLQNICLSLAIEADPKGLALIAHQADGGLRDAQSLLDQILAFTGGGLNEAAIREVLGLPPEEAAAAFDQAVQNGDTGSVFELTHRLSSEGHDPSTFLDFLLRRYRLFLRLKAADSSLNEEVSDEQLNEIKEGAAPFTKEQLLEILALLSDALQEIRLAHDKQIFLEVLLLKIVRLRQAVPIEYLMQKLTLMQKAFEQAPSQPPPVSYSPPPVAEQPKAPLSPPKPVIEKTKQTPPPPKPVVAPPKQLASKSTAAKAKPHAPLSKEEQGKYDTLMQFAAVQLEGRLKKL